MKKFIQKYGFSVGLVILTISLIFVFKEKGDIVESSADSFLDFYTQNLKPLIFETDLSNEDVFNFAFYRNLPVNENRDRVLTISEDYSDNDIIEIKSAQIINNTKNYDRFVSSLALTSNEKEKLDSILSSYKSEINTFVFVSDDNTIAVDPKIGLLSQLVLNDLMRFANDVSENNKMVDKSNLAYSSGLEAKSVNLVKNSVKSADKKELVFIANDTSFSTSCEINNSEIKESIAKATSKSGWVGESVRLKNYVRKPAKPFTPPVRELNGIEVTRDNKNSSSRILVADDFVKGIPVEEMNEFKNHMEEITREYTNFNFSIGSDHESGAFVFHLDSDSEDIPKVKFEINVKEISDMVSRSVGKSLNGNFQNWKEFGLQIDSLSQNMKLFEGDSLIRIEVSTDSPPAKSAAKAKKIN